MPRLLPLLLLLISGPILAGSLMSFESAHTIEEYRALSDRVRELDRAYIERELNALGLSRPIKAPAAKHFGLPPGLNAAFWATSAGQRIADHILSYQTPSGGWSKRTDMGTAPRRPGQAFGVEQGYIPTFDNDATTTQIWLLAEAYQATGKALYAQAATRAIQLILLAQYPNGGWPQNFPLTGGYHDYITYNDNVTVNLLRVLNKARQRRPPLDFIDRALAERAEQSFRRGLQSVLATQVKSNDTATLWGAQHHHLTLVPVNARKFEPAALATAESAELVLFLMSLEQPGKELKQAISAAYHWFNRHQIHGYRWGKTGRHNTLSPAPQAGPLWARFYEIGSDRPVFGDRDGSVHYDVNEISSERRDGYAWYTKAPLQVLKHYPEWQKKHLP